MIIEAYDILVDDDVAEEAGDRPRRPAGWAGPDGPAIDVDVWPRSPRTGQPMLHCFTLWLPEAYRRRGSDLVAVAVFQWEDEYYFKEPERSADRVQPEHPFWADLARARVHPRARVFDDEVASLLAVVWLTEAEFTGPRVTRPVAAPVLVDGEHDTTRWRSRHGVFGPLWLVTRDDPNAGVTPVDLPTAADAYADVPDKYDVFHTEHLGGTCMNPDGVREGLSPWYIEVSRLGGISHGGDLDLALDLAACSDDE
ncbi:MAG: hypothetical protein HOV78_16565 [Hamadaea sp.]|nr:hypothetical protein [Hamadaea sp.]